MEAKLETIKKLGNDVGASALLEMLPENYVCELLFKYSPEVTLRKIQGIQEGLEELRRMEKAADCDVLRGFFESGSCVLGGRDRHGRPVIWQAMPRGVRHMRQPFTEPLLYIFWMILARVRFRESSDTSALFIMNELDRGLLDFNLQYIEKVSRLSNMLFPLIKGHFVLVVPNKALTVAWNVFSRVINLGHDSNSFRIFNCRQDVIDLMEDPDEVPEMFVKGGKPFQMNFSTLGNWRDLVDRRQGFANMTVADIYTPTKEKVEGLRLRYISEEVWDVADETEPLSDNDLQGTSGSSCCSNFLESIQSQAEFLM